MMTTFVRKASWCCSEQVEPFVKRVRPDLVDTQGYRAVVEHANINKLKPDRS